MHYEYKPQGVCSSQIIMEIENDIIMECKFINGCDGNLKGICNLIKGMNKNDVIKKLRGITCKSRTTSCPDQLAQALMSCSPHFSS